MTPYHAPFEHLLEELERVFLRTEGAVRRSWAMPGLHHRLPPPLSRLLAITDIEPVEAQQRRLAEIAKLEERHAAGVRRRVQATLEPALPLVELRRRFDLDDFEIDLLLLILAAEVSPRFSVLFRYLQSDRQRQWIDVQLAAEVLCGTEWQRRRLFEVLAPDGPLVSSHMVELMPAEVAIPAALLYTPLRANRALLDFVVGSPLRSSGCETVHEAGVPLGELVLADATVAAARRLAETVAVADRQRPVLLVSGGRGVGKRSVLQAIAGEVGMRLLELDVARLPEDVPSCERRVREWMLRGTLYGRLCYASHLDELADDARPAARPLLAAFGRLVERYPGPLALEWNQKKRPFALRGRQVMPLTLAPPDARMQEALWTRELRAAGHWLPHEHVRGLAMSFHVTGGVIRDAVRTAASEAAFSYQQLDRSTRGMISSRLDQFAQRIEGLATWDDLLVDDPVLERVRALVGRHRHRQTVLREWEIGARLRLNPGVSALFWGPPGTGKSLAAGVIARELELELYQVDLAMVMSKWLGETEKNLAQLFDEAESGQVVLLFDEADSLFSKRVSGDDTSQAQALAQRVNYILTRLERFRGFAVLTSNREGAIDEAFERRLSAKVQFPMPEEPLRRRLWCHMLGDRWDPEHLDRIAAIEIAGGHIRNACANAAFEAARSGETIGRRFLDIGLRRVLEDMGRIPPDWLAEPRR